MGNTRSLRTSAFAVVAALLLICGLAQGKGKTVYVHLLDGNDTSGNGSYKLPYKSWRVVLSHAGSGDTIIAKNGDYRKAGRVGNWGGLSLASTMADQLETGDPRQPVPSGTPPEAIGIYRYDPDTGKNPRIDTYFDPLPFWYAPFEGAVTDQSEFPIHAITRASENEPLPVLCASIALIGSFPAPSASG